MNLTKEVRDLFTESCKTLMKETEDTNKWKYTPCSWTGRILLKCLDYPKQSTDTIPIKIPMTFFHRNKAIHKFVWNYKRPPKSQNNFERKEQS